MKRILVTTDFSTNSKAGIRFAIQLASQTKCELTFYHILETPKSNAWITNNPKGKKAEQAILLEKLKKFITSMYKESGFLNRKFKCVVAAGIDVSAMITKYGKTNNIDFICISTRGAGIFKKILGTTTSELIKFSKVPVIVVPKDYRKNKINSILYSSDMSNLKSEMATVKKFAKPLSASIHVFNYDHMIEVSEIKNRLNKLALKHAQTGIEFNFKKHHIEKSISEHLQKDINKLKPSLVVLFTKLNKAWYERWFLRNDSEEVTFNTKTPLIIFRKSNLLVTK